MVEGVRHEKQRRDWQGTVEGLSGKEWGHEFWGPRTLGGQRGDMALEETGCSLVSGAF